MLIHLWRRWCEWFYGSFSHHEMDGGIPHVSLRDVEWRKLGACRGLDASIFYPDDDDDAAAAKAVCEGCGVRAACLEHALISREKAGVWGGATERERRRIIRQRRRSA
jgi:WhiB family transcriptional regulator, redox-sensing transcriptional regulator